MMMNKNIKTSFIDTDDQPTTIPPSRLAKMYEDPIHGEIIDERFGTTDYGKRYSLPPIEKPVDHDE